MKLARLDIPTFVRRSTAIWLIEVMADFNKRVAAGDIFWR